MASRTGTRVPFGDATSRANTPNTSQAVHRTGKHTSVQNEENLGVVPVNNKMVSTVASGHDLEQQRRQQQYYQNYQDAYQLAYEQQAARLAQQQAYMQQQLQQQLHMQQQQQQQQQLQQQQLQQQKLQQQQMQQQQLQQQHSRQQQSAECSMLDVPLADVAEESKRNSAASRNSQHTSGSNSRRASQYSACDGFPNKKSYIGPWQLGKTLGKGSSARVRAARHCTTGQPVAVKIIAKKTARMTQSGSIAQLDQFDSSLPENTNGIRRMPLAIEREVAILKLIDHPNIVQLHDIWENRNEIYLVLEYVENGDLFTYVSQNGALTEEAAIFVFRQMMSAVQYCHSLNICHRDLKPENILLKADGHIKIADFGMAALHQAPRSHLQTSCGSPHYAAPELLKARPYHGDKADIWSMGVILFVMLAGRLPFDEDDMSLMLAKAKKGIYTMPSSFSPEAKDLIHRILQTEPEVRISMNKMWQHPLVWKYGYLDDLGNDGTDGPGQGARGTQVHPLDLASIDEQIFRQLRSMWHTLRDEELAAKLISNEQNDQKLFYWLLYNYREQQQENYNPTLTHSVSDYHHVNQPAYAKKVSTRKFSQTTLSGHKRSVSRFTVISNVAETEAGTESGTIKSYDPYKASVVMQPPTEAKASHAKIVVHRNNPNVEAEVRSLVHAEAVKAKASAPGTKAKVYQRRGGSSAYLRASRGSMSSIRSTRSMRSINGRPCVRPSSRHKRGVDFSKARKMSTSGTDATMTGMTSPNLCDEPPAWNEDLTEFSCRIAKDLDDAFMSSLLAVDSSERDVGRDSPFSIRLATPELAVSPATSVPCQTGQPGGACAWDNRPLPPSPPRSDSVQLEIAKVQAKKSLDKDSDASTGVASSNAKMHARLVDVHAPPHVPAERRVVSAPVYSQASRGHARQLPSIQENGPAGDKDKLRAVSAPSKSYGPYIAKNMAELVNATQAENTIRLVVSPTATRTKGPVSVTAPKALHLPTKAAQQDRPSTAAARPTIATPKGNRSVETQTLVEESQLRQRREKRRREEKGQQPVTETIVEEPERNASNGSMNAGSDKGTAPAARRSWFKRQSKTDMRNSMVQVFERPLSQVSRSSDASTPSPRTLTFAQELTKKKSFVFPFWKTSKSDGKLDDDLQAETASSGQSGQNRKSSASATSATSLTSKKGARVGRCGRPGANNEQSDEPNSRKIDPQQNWLSRLFRVKPANRHLCLCLSQRRARQEVAGLLRDWRRYGICNIEVDKKHSIVFAKVAPDNYLGIREVSFACEVITVIEHGKRNHLCILRLTQETGSASSFHKVADTLQGVMCERGLIVPDKRKAKMMVKTLNS